MEQINHSISRRDLLKLMGLSAVGVSTVGMWGFLPQRTLAQGAAPKANAFYTMQVGKAELTVIRDAVFPLDATILGANTTKDKINEVLKANNFLPDAVPTSVNIVVIKVNDKTILLDTGTGVGAGALAPTLELLGIKADAVTDVVISHIHPDHVGGALSNNALTFSKAMYHYPEAEKTFIDSAPTNDMVTANKALLKTAGDASQLTVFKSDTEVLPGLVSILAPGHTVGHTAFRLESEGQSILFTVDTAIGSVVSMAHPEWYAAFDSDGPTASTTRKQLFGDAAAKGTRVLAYHFPFPGTGFIDTDGEGFRFVPSM